VTHDLVIRGGDIVDGTGREPFRGDLAIDAGRISAVGDVPGEAREEIDATGNAVTPGFVDTHTHLDAQLGWDPYVTPVSWHGVTTVLLGNCGVTFAPCRRDDAGLLAGMMESVEDIPGEAILGSLPWDWEDYRGYLDSIERNAPAVNVAGMVGHCAVRFYVMGERAVEDAATDEEKKRMADVVGQSIDGGAIGFSTNRLRGHTLPDGRCIPGTSCDHDELVQIAGAVGRRDGLMQNVFDWEDGGVDAWSLLRKLGATTRGRILFSFGTSPHPESGKNGARLIDELWKEGHDVTALSIPRGSGLHWGLQANLPARNIFFRRGMYGPTWRTLRDLDLEGRLSAIRDAAVCEKLVAEAKAAPPEHVAYWAESSYWMGAAATPNYTEAPENSLSALAERAGEHWSETFLRLSRDSDGRGLFVWRMYNRNLDSLSDLLANEHVIPGLSDAGAHAQQVMDNGVTSFILAHWVREQGLYTLGEGIRRLSSAPARVLGLRDRGALRPGMRADVNVLDPATVGEGYPELVHDLPGNEPRCIQHSKGYLATLVNGRVTVRDNVQTGERPGEVIRHADA
jgi:N-acyl-D-aspartate/D-glutamate deacylase